MVSQHHGRGSQRIISGIVLFYEDRDGFHMGYLEKAETCTACMVQGLTLSPYPSGMSCLHLLDNMP